METHFNLSKYISNLLSSEEMVWIDLLNLTQTIRVKLSMQLLALLLAFFNFNKCLKSGDS